MSGKNIIDRDGKSQKKKSGKHHSLKHSVIDAKDTIGGIIKSQQPIEGKTSPSRQSETVPEGGPAPPLACSLPVKQNEPDFSIKIVVCGASGVGKTSLIRRLCNNIFDSDLKATIGAEVTTYRYQTYEDKKYIQAQIWDTAGSERFKAVTPQFYRGAHAIVAVFDVSDKATYDEIGKDGGYIAEAQMSNESHISTFDSMVMVIGNKVDRHQRDVREEDTVKWANINNFLYFETSAKTSYNVELAFQELIEAIYSRNFCKTSQSKMAFSKLLSQNSARTEKEVRRMNSMPRTVLIKNGLVTDQVTHLPPSTALVIKTSSDSEGEDQKVVPSLVLSNVSPPPKSCSC